MKALLIVDLQNDFCPGGALPVPAGDSVVPVINALIERFPLVVASKDWHPDSTVHFNRWPRHCVQGTHGAELHPDLKQGRIDQIFLKGTGDDDRGYSAFEATNLDLEEFLRQRGVDELCVAGLATDYCVRQTVLDAVARGFLTCVVRDAVKAVNLREDDGERAVAEMKKAGARIVVSSEA